MNEHPWLAKRQVLIANCKWKGSTRPERARRRVSPFQCASREAREVTAFPPSPAEGSTRKRGQNHPSLFTRVFPGATRSETPTHYTLEEPEQHGGATLVTTLEASLERWSNGRPRPSARRAPSRNFNVATSGPKNPPRQPRQITLSAEVSSLLVRCPSGSRPCLPFSASVPLRHPKTPRS